ncbi:mib1 [Symbiodinium natans]|uniref:Mib1 protein n=1 Tax=Symbiodinium natans TaxID=878477 RepID=A0A812NW64_9DINO|nr:mib1 [Symbiodinium natans]
MCRAVADVGGQHLYGSLLDKFEATCQSLLFKVANEVPELDRLSERVDLSLRSFNRTRTHLGQICQSLIAGYFFQASGFRWFEVNGTGKLVHCNSYGCIRDHDGPDDELCCKLQQVLEDAPEAFWLTASEDRPRDTDWRGHKVEAACSFEHDLEGPLGRHLISAEVAERCKQGLEFWGVSDSSCTALKCAVGFTYYYFGLAEILASRSTAAMFALASDNYSEEFARCRQFLQGHRPLKLLECAVAAHCEVKCEDLTEARDTATSLCDWKFM